MNWPQQDAKELRKIFQDPEKLKGFSLWKEIFGDRTAVEKIEFHMELPYEQIKEFVSGMGEQVMSKVPEEEKGSVKWEHVGSTSIKGMPGTKYPDALLIVPEFPPSEGVIQALLDTGFAFCQCAVLDSQDLWFMHIIKEGFLKGNMMTVHLAPQNNIGANILLDTRDMCNSEDWAFQDYKNAKVEASKAANVLEYKMGKGAKSKLLEMLRVKHGAVIHMPKVMEAMNTKLE